MADEPLGMRPCEHDGMDAWVAVGPVHQLLQPVGDVEAVQAVRAAVDPNDQDGSAVLDLWSFVHGYISLELAEHFVEVDDPVAQVLVPMGVNLAVGLGDERERAEASHEAAARLYDSVTGVEWHPSNKERSTK